MAEDMLDHGIKRHPFVCFPFSEASMGWYNGNPWFLPLAGLWFKILDWIGKGTGTQGLGPWRGASILDIREIRAGITYEETADCVGVRVSADRLRNPQIINNAASCQAAGNHGGRYTRAGMGAGSHEVQIVINRMPVARSEITQLQQVMT